MLECSHILGGQWLGVDFAGAAMLLSRSPQSCLNKGLFSFCALCDRFWTEVAYSKIKIMLQLGYANNLFVDGHGHAEQTLRLIKIKRKKQIS